MNVFRPSKWVYPIDIGLIRSDPQKYIEDLLKSINTFYNDVNSAFKRMWENGTWTPEITFATPGDLSVTYTAQGGRYIRIGNRLWIQAFILTSSFTHTTASGILEVTGLPSTSLDTSSDTYWTGGSLVFNGVTKAGYTQFTPTVFENTDYVYFSASGSGQTATEVEAADVPTAGTVLLVFSMEYET